MAHGPLLEVQRVALMATAKRHDHNDEETSLFSGSVTQPFPAYQPTATRQLSKIIVYMHSLVSARPLPFGVSALEDGKIYMPKSAPRKIAPNTPAVFAT